MAHLVYREIIQYTPRDLCLTIRSAKNDHDETTIYRNFPRDRNHYPRKILYNGIMKKKEKKKRGYLAFHISRRFITTSRFYRLNSTLTCHLYI